MNNKNDIIKIYAYDLFNFTRSDEAKAKLERIIELLDGDEMTSEEIYDFEKIDFNLVLD